MSFILAVLTISLCIVAMIFAYRGVPGSARDIGWKMSGVWCNPDNLHVLLHSNGNLLRGHIVENVDDDRADGALVIKELEVKPLWRWSDGTFVAPGSREEHAVQLRLKGARTLKVKFLSENKMEEWRLVDPM